MTKRFHLKAKRRGQAIVEMALITPLLLMLSFGVIDFGYYMYNYVQAANCVREAARRASVRAADAANPPYCSEANLQPTVTANYLNLAAGSEVTATINATHTWLAIGYMVPGLGSTTTISARTSMRMEGQEV